MAKTKFYIVWAPNKKEAFVTDDPSDAAFVAEGAACRTRSAAGEAFREAYCGEDWQQDGDDDFTDPPQLQCDEIRLEV